MSNKQTIALLQQARDRLMVSGGDRNKEEQRNHEAKLREYDEEIVRLGGTLPKSPPPGTDTGGYFW